MGKIGGYNTFQLWAYNGSQDASFLLLTTTVDLHALLLWCLDLPIESALWGATGQPGHWVGNVPDQTKRRIGALSGDQRIELAMRREGLGEGLGLKGNPVQCIGIVPER